jgi:peptide-methionine (S)-S-oxide reductase
MMVLLLLVFNGVKVAVVDSFSPLQHGNSGSSFVCRQENVVRSTACLGTSSRRKYVTGRTTSSAVSSSSSSSSTTTTTLCAALSDQMEQQQPFREAPSAVLIFGNSQSKEEEERLVHALEATGYEHVVVFDPSASETNNDANNYYCYEFSRATGMLKLVSSPSVKGFEPPRWIPMVRGEENVLVANGWSFLDPDESEPLSAFDVDDANAEGEYRPKWGTNSNGNEIEGSDGSNTNESNNAGLLQLSSLGYDLSPLSEDCVLSEADSLSSSSSWANPHSRGVLLDGKTDPPNTKITCNGCDFKGSAGQSDIPKGIFFTAIGGLPLFASKDLSPSTGSSGWLSFSRPLEMSHVVHVEPEKDSMDRRIEVVCARSRCHLGHYFGPSEGYCINASALRFIPSTPTESTITTSSSIGSNSVHTLPVGSKPVSWRPLDEGLSQHDQQDMSPSHRMLKNVLATNHGGFERVALGCGCFWHVEDALRNLQGVVATEACYAGGQKASPTYEEVCSGNTGHAEVVSVVYDPDVVPTSILFDCFLAMHDPTKVRAHGKHALHTGQYRSCVFVQSATTENMARECLEDCQQQLRKDLSTEIRKMDLHSIDTEAESLGDGWCWRAEDRHQRHDERIREMKGTQIRTVLPAIEWLKEYGRRTPSITGGSLESSLHPDDDGMAMMMI